MPIGYRTLTTCHVVTLQIISLKYRHYSWVAELIQIFIAISITVSFLVMGSAMKHTSMFPLNTSLSLLFSMHGNVLWRGGNAFLIAWVRDMQTPHPHQCLLRSSLIYDVLCVTNLSASRLFSGNQFYLCKGVIKFMLIYSYLWLNRRTCFLCF